MAFGMFLPQQRPEKLCRWTNCTRGPAGEQRTFLPPREAPNKVYCCEECQTRHHLEKNAARRLKATKESCGARI